MINSFTPGPWTAVRESAVQHGFKRWHVSSSDGDCFMYVAKALDIGSSKAEREANALLIAAAPELNKFTEDARDCLWDFVGAFGGEFEGREDAIDILQNLIDRADDLTAKARGES